MPNRKGSGNLILISDDSGSINLDLLYKRLEYLNMIYPNFKDWYYSKVLPDLSTNKRRIYITPDYRTIVIVKYSEGKICTFINLNHDINSCGLVSTICNLMIPFIKSDSIKITVPENMDKLYRFILKWNDFEKSNKIKYTFDNTGITRYDIEYTKKIRDN